MAASSRRSASLAAAGADLREVLLECFGAALAAVDARVRTAVALNAEAPAGPWHVVAIGKAAGAMACGARAALGEQLVGGIVVSKPGHFPAELTGEGRLQLIESSHPEPDERSLAAGAAVVEFVAALPPGAQVLYLISGGASSLVESLSTGIGLAELQRLNVWALQSGQPIDVINALRSRVSRIKGGGLAALNGRRRSLALLVSDVPRDDPTVIGSGLLHPPRVDAEIPSDLPPDVAAIVRCATAARSGRTALPRVPYRIVASVRDACQAAARQGRRHGFDAGVSRVRFSGDAGRVGRRLAQSLCRSGPGTMLVRGGESTVTLPAVPGEGGRNQHLALAAADALAGRDGVALLAAGTDGIDGVTADAGAIVDGGTLDRGRDAGLDPDCCLAGADSGRFLEAAGDLLHTGPTLTNVGDLVLGVKAQKER